MTQEIDLKYPIVLVHGLGALGQLGPIEYFYKIPAMLQQAGNRTHVVNLALWNSIDHCAEELDKAMKNIFPGEKVNLIGHSMGGLNARLYTSRFDQGARVASVTTIGTPNKGTAMVDHFLELFLNEVMDKTEIIAKKLNLSHVGFRQLSKKYFDEHFHVHVQDVEGVGYFSATSVIKSPVMLNSLPTFWATHRILKHYEGDNDGFVSEESAKWGTHICTYHGDHYAQIGQPFGKGKLDHLKFFREIVGRLKQEGY
jgi:triacylglycerol lipase